MQPTLRTQRLLLRPRSLADTDDCLRLDHEPEVTRYVNGPWSDPVAHRAFVEKRTRGPYPDGLGYWTLTPSDRPTVFVGWVLLIPVDAIGPEIEIGWRLRPAFWGLGYATEAAGAVLRHGFDRVALDEVTAEIDAANIASIRVAERIGLIRRASGTSEGREWVQYALGRHETAAPQAV